MLVAEPWLLCPPLRVSKLIAPLDNWSTFTALAPDPFFKPCMILIVVIVLGEGGRAAGSRGRRYASKQTAGSLVRRDQCTIQRGNGTPQLKSTCAPSEMVTKRAYACRAVV